MIRLLVTRFSILANECTDGVAVGHLDTKKCLRETESTDETSDACPHDYSKSVSNEAKLVSLRKLYHIRST